MRVVPLRTGGEVLGTVVLLGGARDRAPTKDEVRQLALLALGAAESILRARLYEDAERLATTGKAPGLTNHRTFRVASAPLALAAQRASGSRCSATSITSSQ